MIVTEYRSIGARLRPPRFIVAYRPGQDWIRTARRAIASMYKVWGGNGATIVPVNESDIMPEVLAHLMRQYDPDHIAVHVPFIDATYDDPAEFNKVAKERILQGEDRDVVWSRLTATQADPGDWDGLAEQANIYCSPFKGFVPTTYEFESTEIIWLHHAYNSGGLLSSVSSTPGKRMYTLDLSQVDPVIALMVETRIGSIDPASDERHEAIELPVADADLPNLVRLSITRTTPGEIWNPQAYSLSAVNSIHALDPNITIDRVLTETPFGRSGQSTFKIRAFSSPPVVCVIGETAEDHALALLCDRLFLHASWIPTHLLSEDEPLRETVISALLQLRHLAFRSNRPMLITSVSEPPTAVDSLTAELDAMTTGASTEEEGSIARLSSVESITPSALVTERGRCVLADPVAFRLRRRIPVANDAGDISMLTPIALPMPQIVEHEGSGVCWYVDVWLREHQLPARASLLNERLQNSPYSVADSLVRVSRDGLTFASLNFEAFVGHASPEIRLAQPLLRFPSADLLFAELAAAASAHVERSPAGRRSAIAVEMWGSLSALTADLVGSIRSLLNAFLPPRGARGNYGTGYEIRGNGYVAIEDASTLLGIDQYEARDTIDRLLALKALRQGFLLYCARCRSYDFYNIDQVGSTFECHTCGHAGQLSRGRWYVGDPEPHWYYALDQVVRDLLLTHGDVPLLAIAELSKRSSSVLWSPELEVTDSSGTIELDMCLVIDGRIVVGEAKSNSTLSGDKGAQEVARRGCVFLRGALFLGVSVMRRG